MPYPEYDTADHQYNDIAVGSSRSCYSTGQILAAQAVADHEYWEFNNLTMRHSPPLSTTSDYALAAAVPQAALAQMSSGYISARNAPRFEHVPQEPFQGQGPSHQDFAKDVIRFATTHGGHITLDNALRGDVDDLVDKDCPAFPPASVSSKVSMRIQFADRRPFHHRQVMALRSTSSAESVSRGKLALTIARETVAYLEGREELTVGGRTFPFKQVLLVGLQRVSKGSWQPIFYVVY
ncbi:uncharacterized protein TRAVEDRAFT_45547 [Trametes versicolor FP-101664 SS1]|uniref:uncharacterized protein n=1 Tax=Trametes versicolor (strain FP-101664) TaxID=717944 RepID=UPI00046213C5|nr:uncharacterized protein TRAVEDRAFT_45547 [Trametes versicolor FP-101664 SS1]EIW60297.1 hypothetical protein TRAVEDRAFT_45547 [Trametes versicolor FP-101664 SS1]